MCEEADCEDDQATEDQMRIGVLGLAPLELRDHLLVVQDRTRDQVRKVRHEQRIMRQCIARDIAAIGIDQEGDLRERIEGDTDRQENGDGDAGGEDGIQVYSNEACIFEDAEQDEIAGDTESQHQSARARPELPHDQEQPDDKVERDRRDQKRNELPVAEGIEGERCQRQPRHWRDITAPAECEIAEQDHRQKQENERIGIEEHQVFSGAAP
jgi:hypothetical protein